MIVGIGIDLVDVERIRGLLGGPHAEQARERLFSPRELALAGDGAGAIESLAARFAAKEAAMKALGTGWRGLAFREIEVGRDRRGKPLLAFHGRALERARELHVAQAEVSITHTKTVAAAVVALTTEE